MFHVKHGSFGLSAVRSALRSFTIVRRSGEYRAPHLRRLFGSFANRLRMPKHFRLDAQCGRTADGAAASEDGIMRRRCFLPNGLISFRSEAQPRPARQAVLPLTRHQNIRKAAHGPGNAVSG